MSDCQKSKIKIIRKEPEQAIKPLDRKAHCIFSIITRVNASKNAKSLSIPNPRYSTRSLILICQKSNTQRTKQAYIQPISTPLYTLVFGSFASSKH